MDISTGKRGICMPKQRREKQKKSWGGKRQGAGRKTGSLNKVKRPKKPSNRKRVVRKLYQWTKTEYEHLKQAVKHTETTEAQFVRSAALAQADAVLGMGAYTLDPQNAPSLNVKVSPARSE